MTDLKGEEKKPEPTFDIARHIALKYFPYVIQTDTAEYLRIDIETALAAARRQAEEERDATLSQREQTIRELVEGYRLIQKSSCCSEHSHHGNGCPKWITEEALSKVPPELRT